jgi:heat shock protein HtpX
MAARTQRVELHDRSLERRMMATLLLLAAVYAGLVVVLIGAGISSWIVIGIAFVVVAVQLSFGDRLALRAVGAVDAPPRHYAELHAAVERACIQANMPKPRVTVSPSSMPNALAVGRTRGGATLCVTNPMLRLLDPPELEAVIAHELAHIQNRDALVMTIASFLSLVAALLVKIAARGGHAAVKLVVFGAALATWMISALLLRALSRYRELAADRTAAVITGRPSALASALMKIDEAAAGIPRDDLRKVAPVAALCIAPADAARWQWWGRVTATHPPLARRVDALHALEAQLQRSGPRLR